MFVVIMNGASILVHVLFRLLVQNLHERTGQSFFCYDAVLMLVLLRRVMLIVHFEGCSCE